MISLQKAKKQKDMEKLAKEMKVIKQDQLEKLHEKQKLIKYRRD